MGIPLPSLAINSQQPNPLESYGKVLSLKGLLQNQEFQQQQQPQLLQQQKQATEEGAIDLQMKQLGLKNTQVAQAAFSDPNFTKDLKAWQENKGAASQGGTATPGSSTAVPLHPIAQFLAENKGLSLFGPGGALEISNNLNGAVEKQAQIAKVQGEAGLAALNTHSKQLENFDNIAEPILAEKDPQKQMESLADMHMEIQKHPDLYPPEATQNLDKFSTVQGLQTVANGSKMRQMLIEDATKSAEEKQKTTAAATPTPEQIQNATSTVNTYNAVPQNMRAALSKEMANAPDYASLEKVQTRADAANESFQRSADARAQADALKDVGLKNIVAGKLAGEDQKLGAALDQTAGIRGLLNMSKGGNQAATAAALTRFAEHEIVEGGVKRMNQLEYENLATKLGSYGRKFQSWVDGGFKGEMPPATNAEIHTILDAEDATTNASHDRNVGYIKNRYLDKNTEAASPATAPTQQPAAVKVLTQAQIQQAATDHGVSVEEATRQAKAAGYNIQ